MHIGELARRANVSVKTIRYYERIGVLNDARRLPSGYRDYDADVVDRVGFIRACQASGLRLGEIRGIVALRDRGESPCAHVLEILEHRAEDIDRQIHELERARDAVAQLVERAKVLRPRDCAPTSICHLIPT